MEQITADVFIEISRNSHIKYEYDKEKKMIKKLKLTFVGGVTTHAVQIFIQLWFHSRYNKSRWRPIRCCSFDG